jgi:hypothetical protein
MDSVAWHDYLGQIRPVNWTSLLPSGHEMPFVHQSLKLKRLARDGKHRFHVPESEKRACH